MPRKKQTDSTNAGEKGEIVAAPVGSREFRKANEAIGLRVVEGSLTLLNRKVFNVLMGHAQELGETGKRAPVDTPTAKKYFWVPLSELARDAHYDSKDMKLLRDLMSEMQDIKLLLETETQWTSERLISSITFVNPKGLNSRSGQVWVGFAFPPEVHETVMQPRTYTRLIYYYQGMFRSGASLALYEVCRRYATNPSKLTNVETYMYWYGVITGNPVPDSEDDLPEYKYFKRDVLKPAIAEVSKLTDIEVTLIEHKEGRRIGSLQFKVELSKQPQLEFEASPAVDVSLLERLMQIGFTQTDAQDILGKHENAKIQMALDVVDSRDRSDSPKKIDSKPAYFRWALKEGVKPTAPRQLAKSPARDKPEGPSTLERFLAARGKNAFQIFLEMDDAQRQAVYNEFKAQASIKIVPLEKLADNGVQRTELGMWYAEKLFGKPSLEELSTFADNNKVVQADQKEPG